MSLTIDFLKLCNNKYDKCIFAINFTNNINRVNNL